MDHPKIHSITIRVSPDLLNEIDEHTPDRCRVCREQFVMDTVQAYLGHAEKAVYARPRRRR